jgi:cardiolipin synthase
VFHYFFPQVPIHEKRITFSTIITLTRIALTPFVVIAMVRNSWNFAFILFLIAALTDLLDGQIARFMNETTILGAWLDPIADKFLIISCFLTLIFIKTSFVYVPIWFILCVLCKELCIVLGVLLLSIVNRQVTIAPTFLGKVTTCIQLGFLCWVFVSQCFHIVLASMYYGFVSVVVCFLVTCLIQYGRIGIRAWLLLPQ